MARPHEDWPVFELEAPRRRGDAQGDPSDAAFLEDPETLRSYLSDASGLTGRAEVLARPCDEAEIAAALRRAAKAGIPVTVSAARTSTTGASIPSGGLVLSMERLDRVLEIDVAKGFARAEPGVLLGDFQRAIEARGGLYPPDPTSREECTLGGSVACNASGARSFLYGATRRWVRGLRVVLVSGEVLVLRRGEGGGAEGFVLCDLEGRARSIAFPRGGPSHPPKHAAGYPLDTDAEPIDLLIGSEGTLGVISEIEVALRPAPPRVLALLAGFRDAAGARALVREGQRMRAELRGPVPPDPRLLRRSIVPRCLEYFDAASLTLLRELGTSMAPAPEAGAAIYLEQECVDVDHEAEMVEAWAEILARTGALVDAEKGVQVATTDEQRRALHGARHAVPSAITARAAARGMPKLGTDLAVDADRLDDVLALYAEAMRAPLALLDPEERVALESGLAPGATRPDVLEAYAFGHLGDCHLHVNFLPEDETGLALARAVHSALTRRVLALGGTPSAEHGIGKTKHDALAAWAGAPVLEAMRTIKRGFDPQGCLAPGNLFAPSERPEVSEVSDMPEV